MGRIPEGAASLTGTEQSSAPDVKGGMQHPEKQGKSASMYPWMHAAQARLETLLFDHVKDQDFPCVVAKAALAPPGFSETAPPPRVGPIAPRAI